jgi:hypothetical protein
LNAYEAYIEQAEYNTQSEKMLTAFDDATNAVTSRLKSD